MNPPSALHGAMSQNRKPFTYTPGGLDLSEIKSERMAKRLMRNAMNQGVPEVPSHPIQSPPMPSTPIAVPNYNCMPVQVFPTFNLPANPKALLRSRSNPEPKDQPVQRVIPSFTSNASSENNNIPYKNTVAYPQVNNNKPVVPEYKDAPRNIFSLPRTNYGSDGYSDSILPEISYEAEYFRALPRNISNVKPLYEEEESNFIDKVQTNELIKIPKDSTTIQIPEVPLISITPLPVVKIEDEIGTTQDEKKEVKVVKKISTKQNNVEEQNGDKNGDTVEAELTVQLPTKKSAAKTETKVEVEKRVLPDGSTEVVKKTITTTTIDGKTEIRTKTETTIIPKELEESEEEVVEEEEEEEEVTGETEEKKNEQKEEIVETKTISTSQTKAEPKENGHSEIIKTEEKSEVIATKKVVVIQETPDQDEETEEVEEETVEQEESEEAEPVTIVLKKQPTPEPSKPAEEPVEDDKEEVEEEIESETEVEADPAKPEPKPEVSENKVTDKEEKETVEEEVVEEEEDEEEVTKVTKTSDSKNNEEEEEVYEEADDEEVTKEEKESEELKSKKTESVEEVQEEVTQEETEEIENTETVVAKTEIKDVDEKESIEVKVDTKEAEPEPEVIKLEPEPQREYNIPIREPSVPMEKVEDVEIKPIGSAPIITKSHTENTEIITSKIDPSGGISRQTEYNKIENIVTVNRTTKILDQNYENLTQQGIPTVKTYFVPPIIDRISTSPLPSRPYQSQYSEPTTERRHSLLLERLSMERQMPSEIYSQYSTQIQEQSQMDEPRVEVLTVSNVKPSTITNQQWYQQSKQQNTIYNNVSSTPTPSSQPWAQPKTQPQQQYQPQPQYQAQPSQAYQPPAQPQYQPTTPTQYQPSTQQYQPSTPQYQPPTPTQYQPPTPTQYQPPTSTQYQPPPQPQYQPPPQPQPQYQTYTDHSLDRTQSNYSSYTPAPSWPSNVADKTPAPPTQYSYYNKDSTDSYQNTTQNYSSSYVPPPWEQDTSYTSPTNTHTIYQVPAQTTPTSSLPPQSWKPAPAPAKQPKTPISFIPPAPNQSFVKPVSSADLPRVAGRKTYYSEYERRYITVPESTYIPNETRYQPQPDPSPQYYYDNNEQPESVEPQWRRELREFTEKTSQTQQTETTSVQPPWELESKYMKPPQQPVPNSSTPTWSQTLRPRSWRERSFESEYVGSQEWPKTNTLGRGRPLSTLGKSTDSAIPERVRGVSVDRYNPNSYHSPAEHPPVQAHTLTTPVPHHNPNVPGYHARASAEPREQPYQTRVYREARESPIQSRSFKYLQWITGTDN